MPAERAPMRKVREVLRLRHAPGVSERQIAITTGLSRSTVGEYLRWASRIAFDVGVRSRHVSGRTAAGSARGF